MKVTTVSLLLPALFLSACYGAQQPATSTEKESSPPNIILVMTDDQGYGDLGCHGHPFLKTPNLDKLYTQSTRFTDFHTSATCAPTRGSLMSGLAPFKVGITHTIYERERMALSATTIAEVLQDAGYATGIFGKWHLGEDDAYQPEKRGFDEVFIHGAGGIGQVYPGSQADVPGNSYFDPILKHNDTFVQTEGYCTDVFFQQALAWINAKKTEQPFFAYLSTNAPHGPFIAPEEYAAIYAELCDDVPEAQRDEVIHFLGMITNIDDNMGLLMEKLDAWQLTDNTVLIFMTDNGTARGDLIYNAGLRGRKATRYEGATKVPFFVRYPGVSTAGVDVDRFARHYDLFPTFAEIANAKLPADLEIDGRSLLPLISNPESEWADRLSFFHLGRWSEKGQGEHSIPPFDPEGAKYQDFAVRSEEWRLVGKLGESADSPALELFDMVTDPGETNTLISQYPERAQAMLEAYDKWWQEVRPLMVNEDAPLDAKKQYLGNYEKQKAMVGIPKWTPAE
ncbi:MAG: arylsulfatase [Puniceicoccaceae bacterium]|jgi:arylsulfatase|nr:arylsulfatase [Puniceicoccaceae bacterium]